ncbi:hypothetical protein E2562_002899 [Oryza meyeriana var. granulata]|uniref:Uncharacterized protein n=1 Tax=Oryza meyeriana var. granulata TaxID=110450 RepID=A0A6G1DE41_9ORYZ|nr:hypothetical protein E2562_002899 [Oryza meyeriana var. granulata]
MVASLGQGQGEATRGPGHGWQASWERVCPHDTWSHHPHAIASTLEEGRRSSMQLLERAESMARETRQIQRTYQEDATITGRGGRRLDLCHRDLTGLCASIYTMGVCRPDLLIVASTCKSLPCSALILLEDDG